MHRALIALPALLALAFAPPAQAQKNPLAVEHLAQALRIPTVSHQDPARLDAAAFEAFVSFLRETYPATFARLEVEPVNRHSLLLRWPGTDAERLPVLFDAHYDVVPIEPGTEDDWTHPPFAGTVSEGYLWGRGALDDKNAVITTLEATESLAAEGFTPTRTLYFSFVHDEEIGGRNGAGGVVALLASRGVRCDYVIGEGGGILGSFPLLPGREVAMIALAEKGYLTLTLRSSGTGGHSSTPPRDSSIVRLARALATLHENPFDARLVPPVDQMLRAVGEQRGGVTGWMLRNQALSRPLLLSQLAKDRLGSAMIRTTTAVTMIDAGVKENVVPQRAEARVNFRLLPDETPEQVIAAVRARIDDPGIEIESSPWAGNPGVADVEGEGYARIRAALEAQIPGVAVVPGLLMATTDSRHYSAIAHDVYRFHPIRIDPELVAGIHGTDERVPVSAIEPGVRIFEDLIRRVGGPR